MQEDLDLTGSLFDLDRSSSYVISGVEDDAAKTSGP
jgi:hypothetical protein